MHDVKQGFSVTNSSHCSAKLIRIAHGGGSSKSVVQLQKQKHLACKIDKQICQKRMFRKISIFFYFVSIFLAMEPLLNTRLG